MLDFMKINIVSKKDSFEVVPSFTVGPTCDLMIRGGDFYAIWDEKSQFWRTNELDAIKLIDTELAKFYDEHKEEFSRHPNVLYLHNSDNKMIDKWHKFVQKQMRDTYVPLDENLVFSDQVVKKEDYVSRVLPYSLKEGDTSAYNELMSVLYSPEERHKIEWAIGAILSGDSKDIQKFMVLYGSAGTGKSTVLNIIQDLFPGYYTVFDAKALGSSSDAFALEPFRGNPLIAIQHDGDLSRIEDNTRLNSIVSHEYMTINEKFKATYSAKINAFLFMGTNKPVKITDAKSGIIRRLIDVSPTGNKVSLTKYNKLTKQIKFEHGAIAYHCLKVYEENKQCYENYIPYAMFGASNDFYNFALDSYDIFSSEEGVTLKSAWELYKTYCQDANVSYPMSLRVFKEELKNYFKLFDERARLEDGTRVRNYYRGFLKNRFEVETDESEEPVNYIDFGIKPSIFDLIAATYKAQYANEDEKPIKKWSEVTTKLYDLDTSKLHYVLVPENHIVIDFDLKDENGEKSYERNLEAASKWPKTYAELSKSGKGIHLHYIYTGDPKMLARLYDKDIEIKVFHGRSSLRRKLTKCNDQPIATISSGLPLKEEKKVVNETAVKNEKHLRQMITKNLKKEIHADTASSVNFIYSLLEEVYNSGITYDVSDMRPSIISFAAGSTHQSAKCLTLANKMHYKSDEPSEANTDYKTDKLVFYDVEVFPNLFIICFKPQDGPVSKLINPKPSDIEDLIKFKLVGFNCRRYDNHILYARLMGYSNEQLYRLSQRIINENGRDAFFSEAYNLSYTDIYDFCSKKQSLKKWEIELGIHHQELGIPWDKPVPEEQWDLVADYCVNDVIATEATFNANQQDFIAREILADITGLTVNDTTNTCTTKLIVGNEKNPQNRFVYTDLSTIFPGYIYDHGISTYRGEEVGEGGYVYSEPGMYSNIALLDVSSMHPHSAIALNIFGPYTKNFEELVQARIYIKHGDFEKAGKLFDGKLKPYLTDKKQAKALAYALKIAINSVYGLTAANFPNKLRDPRNIDNIVAKRGALFMVNLKHEVQDRGFTVAHIKTDSIKIPDATPEIISFVMEYGKQYGYTFEHEATYEKMCLVNDAVYIAKYSKSDKCLDMYNYIPEDNSDFGGQWTATGTQFQVPYVFKTLFSKEPVEFEDLCETKSVTTALYLDMNEDLKEDEHNYVFIGRAGQFCPIKPGCGGGILLREKDGKYSAATGSKGYRWLESEVVKNLHKEEDIDRSYYEHLCEDAIISISEFGDFEWFAER